MSEEQTAPVSAQSRRRAPVVAIDGPAGAGKSTVSKRVAEQLGFILLDTGAIYRCVGLAAQRAGYTMQLPLEAEQVAAIARELVRRGAIAFRKSDGKQRVVLDGEDVSQAIRTASIGELTSVVSVIPEVREALLELQRSFGRDGGVVVEGRDIGSVVFPDAEAKFFLTASVPARAARRHAELVASQPELTLQDVQQQVVERDRRDSSRPVAPLLRADDAELVDSTELGVDEVVARIVERVKAVQAALAASPGES